MDDNAEQDRGLREQQAQVDALTWTAANTVADVLAAGVFARRASAIADALRPRAAGTRGAGRQLDP